MRIETKYNIGDTIWISDGEKPRSHIVIGLVVQIADDHRRIVRYKIHKDDTYTFVFGQHCYNSYEECEKAIDQQNK